MTPELQAQVPPRAGLAGASLGRRDLLVGVALAVLLVAGNLLVVSSQLGVRHKARAVLEWDHHFYIAMARPAEERAGLRSAHLAPYCYRVLAPFVADRLTAAGLQIHSAFYLVTNLSLVGFLTALYLLLRLRQLSVPDALLGVTLVGLAGGAVRWYEYQYWMSDPPALFLLVLAMIAVEVRADAALLGICVFGALTRETVVLALAYAVLRRFETGGLAEAARLAALLIPAPLAVLAALRYAIIAAVGPGTLDTVREALAERSQDPANQLYLATLGSFGVVFPMLWLFPVAALRRVARRPSAACVVALVYASLTLGNNTDRLLAYALPAVLPLALSQLRALSAATHLRWAVLASLALALQLHGYAVTPFFGIKGLSAHQATQPAVVLTLTGGLVAAWLLLWSAQVGPWSSRGGRPDTASSST